MVSMCRLDESSAMLLMFEFSDPRAFKEQLVPLVAELRAHVFRSIRNVIDTDTLQITPE
jgi:hypothetical protein